MTEDHPPVDEARLTELAQYNRVGRAKGFFMLIPAPTVGEMDEIFELAKQGLRAAARSAVGEEGLDVERLTAAVFEAIYQSRATHPDDARNDAEAIATHYAALAAEPSPEGEEDASSTSDS